MEREFLMVDPQQVLDGAPVIALVLDNHGAIEHVNSYFERLMGWRLEEIRGKDWSSTCVPAHEREQTLAFFRSAARGAAKQSLISAVVTRDGRHRQIEWSSQLILDGQGRIHGLLATGIDVTERRRAEEQLRQTLDRLDALLAALPYLLLEVDESGVILDCRTRQIELLSMPPELLLGKTISEVFSPEGAEVCLAAIREAAEKGIGGGNVCQLLQPGDQRWFEPWVSRRSYQSNQALTFNFLAREVTSPTRPTERVAETEDHFRHLVENVPYCIHELDKEGRFLSINPAGLRMINEADQACVIGRRCLDFVSDADRPRIAEILNVAQNGQKTECQFACKSGCFIHSNFVPIEHGKVMGISLDITKQVEIESALSKSEARYRRAERGANDGLWEWNLATGDIYFSPRYSEMLGYAAGELPNDFESFAAALHPDEHTQVLRTVSRHVQSGRLIDMEIRLRRKAGDYLWIHTRGVVDYDEAGKPALITGTIRDISERKQAASALQQEHDRLKQILDAQFGFVCVLTLDGAVMEANQTALRLMKRSRDGLLGQRFWEVGWLESGAASQTQAAVRAAAGGESIRGILKGQFPDLGRREVDMIFAPLRGPTGNVVNVIAFGVDITEGTQAVEALRKSEARLNEAQRIARIGSWELDYTTKQLVWSDEIFRIFEIEPAHFEASYEAFLNAIHPEDREMVNTAYNDSVMSREPYEVVHRLLMADGRVKFVRETCETDYDATGHPIRSVGIIQDITESTQAEKQRREIDDRLRLVLENINDGFFILDRDWHIVQINLAGAAMLRRSLEQLIGCCYFDEFPEMVGTVWDSAFVCAMQLGQSATAELWNEPLDRWFEARVYPFAGGISVFFADITERKQAAYETQHLRETLAHANRLQTLSELASGLAHELNQPLGVISMDASTAVFLSQELNCPELHTCLRRINEQAFRAGEIVRRIRSFIRRDSSPKEPHDVNLLVREVLLMLGDRLRHSSVTIQLKLAEHLPPVMVDGIQIQQVLVNLIRNAEDAMSQIVHARRVLTLETEAISGEIRVTVSDNGCGLDPDMVAKLFFPFQTTKAAGLGLGLVTCRTIIEAHGGRIEACPDSTQGTRFVFTLPVT